MAASDSSAVPLRVLFVTDREEDVGPLAGPLRRAGFEPAGRRAATAEEFLAALAPAPDLIVWADVLPRFGAPEALRLLRERGLDVPLIVVAASASEEGALEAVRQGAADYVFRDRPGRLGAAARRALEQRQHEERLRRQLEFTSALTDSLGEGVFAVDPAGRATFLNPAAERILGWKEEELLGKDMHDAIHSRRADGTPISRAGCAVLGVLRSGATAVVRQDCFTCKDGRVIPVAYTSSPIRGPRGTAGAVVAFQDIGEQLRREERYRQAQKMEAVGQLAGGVAHDFNNLLTIINGYGALLLEQFAEGDPARDVIREITAAGDRAAALTRQLLAFSRRQILAPRVLDLRAVVADLERMLRRLIGEDIQLVTAADPDAGLVRADPSQIDQVLLNLAVNARDAMPRGGRLTLAVRNAEPGEVPAEGRGGPYVLLAVGDTGHGMTAEVKARLFEPFFSTKGEQGTGLGLATVYGIVRQSGGHIEVESEPGRGSTFKVYLPRAPEGATPTRAVHGLGEMPHGTETVLLVEDEEGVRALARHILRGCGYTVLEAGHGDEALRLAAGHAGPIHLLVCDVILPRLGGRELAARLTARRRETRVLFVSGYTDDAVVRHGVREEEVDFLQKPFTAAALACKVREVLSR